jgi:NTE family protein
VPRCFLPLEEKDEDGKYLLSFPLQGWRISLPRGLSGGENISLLLSELTLPAQGVHDFKKLPIPFACAATDISTGQLVLLDHGSLPEAIRASMAIPSLFTPVEIEGRLLVDGMVARNFPVSNVKDMGADLIVGVDVGTALYRKEELDTLPKILDQTISFFGAAEAAEQNRLCTVLIIPDTRQYGSTGFSDSSALVAIGEAAARAKLPELRALAAQLKASSGRPRSAVSAGAAVAIAQVSVEGLRRVSRELVDEHLQILPPVCLPPSAIRAAVLRLYGSGFFERVTYTLEPGAQDQMVLHIRIVETESDALKVGLGYDSDTQSALLFNGTFRNLWVEGSKIALDVKLGENAAFKVSRFVPFGWISGLGFDAGFQYNRFDIISRNREGQLPYRDYLNYAAAFCLQKNFLNAMTLGAGLEKEWASIQADAPGDPAHDRYVDFFNYRAYARLDTLDRTYFPRAGVQGSAEVRRITRELALSADPAYPVYDQYAVRMKAAIPIHPRVSVFGGGAFGAIAGTGAAVHFTHQFHAGGLYDDDPRQTAFPGFHFMEHYARALWVTQAGVQVEVLPDVYALAQANLGRLREDFHGLWDNGPSMLGGALTLGGLSPIGPLELSIVYNTLQRGPMVHFSLGRRY